MGRPRQQQPQQPQLQPPPLHHQKAVDPLVGPRINGAMMRTTMPNAIGTVELVVSMILVIGTTIAKIVNVKSAHQLAGMEMTIVMMISIPKVVNGMEETAVVMSTQTTALIVNALILRPNPGYKLTSTKSFMKTNSAFYFMNIVIYYYRK